jgi:hypothetical protein
MQADGLTAETMLLCTVTDSLLTAGGVIPGFSVPVKAIFAD